MFAGNQPTKEILFQSRQAVNVQKSRLPNEQKLLCSLLLSSEQILIQTLAPH